MENSVETLLATQECITLYEQISLEAERIRSSLNKQVIGVSDANKHSPAFRKIRRLSGATTQQILDNAPCQLLIEVKQAGGHNKATLESYIEELIKIAKEAAVDHITLSWLFVKFNNLYMWLERNSGKDGLTRSDLYGQLSSLCQTHGINVVIPDENVARQEKKAMEDRINDLIELLLQENPEIWHPDWINACAPSVYNGLCEHFGTIEGVRWKQVIDHLPSIYADRFVIYNLKQNLVREYPEEEELYFRGRQKILQNSLASIFEEKMPNKTIGIDSKDTASPNLTPWKIADIDQPIYEAIGHLQQTHPDRFSWYSFMAGVEGNWIESFETQANNLEGYAEKLHWLLVNRKHAEWSIYWLMQTYNSIYVGVKKLICASGVGDYSAWSAFFQVASDEVVNRYNPYEDEVEFRRGQQSDIAKNSEVFYRKTARQIEEIVANSNENWKLQDIARANLTLFNRIASIGCFRNIIPYLCDTAFDRLVSTSSMMQCCILAEKVRRDIGTNYTNGWRVSGLKNAATRKRMAQYELSGRIDLILHYCPKELRIHFMPKGKRSVSRSKTANVLKETSVNSDTVNEILSKSEYFNSGIITIDLLLELRNQIDEGNAYAVIVVNNILETFLFQQGVELSLQKGNLAEVLGNISEDTPWEEVVVRYAYRLRNNKSMRSIQDDMTNSCQDNWTLEKALPDRTMDPAREVEIREAFEQE